MLWTILAIIISYLLGSIPTAYIYGRVFKKIDIRKLGSGNVGATNALRVLGKRAGIIVLLLDILKGSIAVVFLGDLLAPKMIISDEAARVILGLACISGHNWTIFLNFKGGKGVATTFGVLLGLALRIAGLKMVLLLAILTWLSVFIISRIVSLASVVTAIGLPLYALLFKVSFPVVLLSSILSIFLILRHRSNLKRLLQGKEPQLDFRKKPLS
ncbi:MAG: glycerol-3-phosphate 1-O-acyltransferase PlsY [Candidatus Omnitrophica bacterium]|nr:glycerol-3-phosphate 1-O-acyltransferase PlsY [Candidatus Omnitrophota bacterium]